MSLSDKLFTDMKEAMKEREKGKLRVSTIRLVRAAQKESEIDKHRPLSDEEIIEIISREVKKRREVIGDYEKAQRAEMVEQLREEINILTEYLPKQLGENEIKSIIREAIQEIQANSPQDIGKVMKNVMPRLKARADGKIVKQYVSEMLQ